jgi:hypothetical protein
LKIFKSEFREGKSESEYIRQIVKALRKYHDGDRENENARKESLS